METASVPVGKTDRTSGRRGQRRGYGARRAARDRVAASEGSGRDGRRVVGTRRARGWTRQASGRDATGEGSVARRATSRSPRHSRSPRRSPIPAPQPAPLATPGSGAGTPDSDPETHRRRMRGMIAKPRAPAPRARHRFARVGSLSGDPKRKSRRSDSVRVGIRTLTETVLEAAGKGLEVAHATSSGGATADSLRGPVV